MNFIPSYRGQPMWHPELEPQPDRPAPAQPAEPVAGTAAAAVDGCDPSAGPEPAAQPQPVPSEVTADAENSAHMAEVGDSAAPLPLAGEPAPDLIRGAGGGSPSANATSDTPTPDPSREREGDEGRSHPAGRGWTPLSRDVGIPGEHGDADPVAALGHSQVFTRELRVRFLDHLAFQGNARAAAARVGVSHETAYRKRRQDAVFAGLWDAALVHARHYAESELGTRALDGIEVPVWHRGEITGYHVKHDTRLLFAHIARLDRRVETDVAAKARAERFDELLADYAGHEAPEGFAEAAEQALDWRDRGTTPELPPTRQAYVASQRSEAARGRRGSDEARAMAAAGERAGATWDAWHDGSLGRVDAIVEEAGEGDSTGAHRAPSAFTSLGTSPVNGGGSDGGGSDQPDPHPFTGEVSAQRTEGASATNEGEPAEQPPEDFFATPEDLPYEVKSYPQDRVTGVNTPRQLPGSAALGSPYIASRHVDLQGERTTMSTPIKNLGTKGTIAAAGALALGVVASGPAAAQFGGPPPPPNTGVPLYAKLTGGKGQGQITVVVDPPKGTACYIMNVSGLEGVTAAHIHTGGPGETGRPVVTLEAPADGSSGGCQQVSAELSAALLGNPDGYYVNVHTRVLPNGAIRGQLSDEVAVAGRVATAPSGAG